MTLNKKGLGFSKSSALTQFGMVVPVGVDESGFVCFTHDAAEVSKSASMTSDRKSV
jgi:hypothetical protein